MSQFVAQAAKLQLISRHQVLFYEFCVAEKKIKLAGPDIKAISQATSQLCQPFSQQTLEQLLLVYKCFMPFSREARSNKWS